MKTPIEIEIDHITLNGDLVIPSSAKGLVLFAHGSGSSRLSPRNQFVASTLNNAGFGTLLMDLLTKEEEDIDRYTSALRFNIRFLASRLSAATQWVTKNTMTSHLTIGYFGASTGAAAALVAASKNLSLIKAIVSRGGRPDLAEEVLAQINIPTLLIVGGNDPAVIQLNKKALAQLEDNAKLEIVPHASHLFEEPGTLEQVAQLASEWFTRYLH